MEEAFGCISANAARSAIVAVVRTAMKETSDDGRRYCPVRGTVGTLDGFRVLTANESLSDELCVSVETTADVVVAPAAACGR